MRRMTRALAFTAVGGVIAATWACAEIQIVCPAGTVPHRRVFSGGSETEWCDRRDGVRQGLEVRYYESGAPMVEGAHVDGVRFGEWVYYPSVGPAWRRERWEDGALVDSRVELPPRGANQPPADPTTPTTSQIISLGSADPTLGRVVRDDELPAFAVWYASGKPRVLGRYDRDGYRTRSWRFWHENGALAREVTYDAGVRHGPFREWWENGRAKTDGAYDNGERDGRWQRWDEAGRVASDATYDRGMVSP